MSEREVPKNAYVPEYDDRFWEVWDGLDENEQAFLVENWRIRQLWLDGEITQEGQDELCERSKGKFGFEVGPFEGNVWKAWQLGRPELSTERRLELEKEQGL